MPSHPGISTRTQEYFVTPLQLVAEQSDMLACQAHNHYKAPPATMLRQAL